MSITSLYCAAPSSIYKKSSRVFAAPVNEMMREDMKALEGVHGCIVLSHPLRMA
jgi:hypothetical protein